MRKKRKNVEETMPSEQTPDETRRDWEVIQPNGPERTERLKIAQGWLYRTITDAGQVAMVFVSSS
jgi:hypothetical protein